MNEKNDLRGGSKGRENTIKICLAVLALTIAAGIRPPGKEVCEVIARGKSVGPAETFTVKCLKRGWSFSFPPRFW